MKRLNEWDLFCFYDSTIQRGQRRVRMDKWSISQVILSEVSLRSLRLCSRTLCGREIVMWETVKIRIIELIECSDMCEQKSRNELGLIQDQLGGLTRNWFSGLNLVFHLGSGPYLNLEHAKILPMWHLAETNIGAQTSWDFQVNIRDAWY